MRFIFQYMLFSVCLCGIMFSQTVPPSTAEKFNERGFLQGSGKTLESKEVIGDYDGNLMLLYSTMVELPDELSGAFTVTYNANVEHRFFDDDDNTFGYMINTGEWILGFKGIALQTLNFTNNFFAKHDNGDPISSGYLEGTEAPLLIPGYHYSNDLGSAMQLADQLQILKSDGSKIILHNVEDGENDGMYVEQGVDTKGLALVEVRETVNGVDLRNVAYKPGDGLTYIFREEAVNYYDPLNPSHEQQTVLYLEKIYAPFIDNAYGEAGLYLLFNYFNQGYGMTINYGRKLFGSMTSFRADYEEGSSYEIEVDYSYATNYIADIKINNYNSGNNILLTLEPEGEILATTRNSAYKKICRVNEISDDAGRKDVISYFSLSDNYTKRTYRLSSGTGHYDFSINHAAYLPQFINYHHGKETEFRYYGNLYTTKPDDGVADTWFSYVDFNWGNSFMGCSTNINYAYRDHFTNFMIYKRIIENKVGSAVETVRTQTYDYSRGGSESYDSPTVDNIYTQMTHSSNLSDGLPSRKETKTFSKRNTNYYNYNAGDHHATIKTTVEKNEDLTSGDYIENDYTYDYGTYNSTEKYWDGSFYLTDHVVKKKQGSSSIITVDMDVITYTFETIEVGSSYHNNIKIVKEETHTDPNSVITDRKYKNFLAGTPNSTGSEFNLGSLPTFGNFITTYLNADLYYHIGNIEEEKVWKGTDVKSHIFNEFYTGSWNIGRIKKAYTNYSTRPVYKEYTYYGLPATTFLPLSINYNGKYDKTFFYPEDASDFVYNVDGEIVNFDNSTDSPTFKHKGIQFKPIKTRLSYNSGSDELNSYAAFDSKGRPKFEVDYNDKFLEYEHDAVGRIKTATLPGGFANGVSIYSDNNFIGQNNEFKSFTGENHSYIHTFYGDPHIFSYSFDGSQTYTGYDYFSYFNSTLSINNYTTEQCSNSTLYIKIMCENILPQPPSNDPLKFNIRGIKASDGSTFGDMNIVLTTSFIDNYYLIAVDISPILLAYKNSGTYNSILGLKFCIYDDTIESLFWQEYKVLGEPLIIINSQPDGLPLNGYKQVETIETGSKSIVADYIDNVSNVNSVSVAKRINADPDNLKSIETEQIFDSFGQVRELKTKNDASNYITKETKKYNYLGLVQEEDNAEDVTLAYDYDFIGKLESTKLENLDPQTITQLWSGGTIPTTSIQYFESEEISDAEGRTKTIYYDNVGNKIGEKLGSNDPTVFTYNGIYQLTSVVSPEGRTATYTYDDEGNIESRTTPDDGTYEYKYDKYGNLRFTYHTSGSEVVFHSYDDLNRLEKTGIVNEYEFPYSSLDGDITENFESLDKYLVLKNVYDDYTVSGIFSSIPSKSAEEIENMNLKGRLFATAYRDEESTSTDWNIKYFEYDHQGYVFRLSEKIYNETWKFIENGYDHIGNLVSQSINDEHFIWNEYDVQGRLVKVKSYGTDTPGSATVEAEYSYNEADQIEGIGSEDYQEILDNLTVSSTQDYGKPLVVAKNVTVTSSGDLTLRAGSSITLEPGFSVETGGEFHAVIDATIGNGYGFGKTDYDYDSAGWVKEINNNSGGVFERFNESLTYEDNGNIYTQSITNKGNPSWDNLSFTFGYDNANRLTGSTCSSNSQYTETFTYDDDGNFLTKNGNGKNYTYSYFSGTNKLETINSYFRYEYDNKGNIKLKENYSDGTDLFKVDADDYDHRNLPFKVWDATNGNINYSYDDKGNRIRKDVGTTDDYYLRDHTGKEVAIYNLTTDAIDQVNIFGNGMVGYVKKDTPDERFYYVKDHLGSIRLVVDEEGEISSARDYYAYGGILQEYIVGDEEKYKFTEKERDSETGLDYFGARYFDSDIGRWTSVDPLAAKYPGWSQYSYSANNPYNNIDPNGMWFRSSNGRSFQRTPLSTYKAASFVSTFLVPGFSGVATSILFPIIQSKDPSLNLTEKEIGVSSISGIGSGLKKIPGAKIFANIFSGFKSFIFGLPSKEETIIESNLIRDEHLFRVGQLVGLGNNINSQFVVIGNDINKTESIFKRIERFIIKSIKELGKQASELSDDEWRNIESSTAKYYNKTEKAGSTPSSMKARGRDRRPPLTFDW